MLAEELHNAGYATAGFTANMLIGSPDYARGFDAYKVHHALPVKKRADVLHAAALGWIDRQRSTSPPKSMFVYLHYMEPHEPLQPPSDVLQRLALQRDWSPEHIDRLKSWTPPDRSLGAPDAATIASMEDLYDAEVASIDGEIARFLDELDRRGVLSNAVVVISSDHGEEFLDHGEFGHGHTLYEELIRVPLLISYPGQQKRRDVRAKVSLIDIAPTLLDMAGVVPPSSFEGTSLRDWLEASTLGHWWQEWTASRHPPVAYSELPKNLDAVYPQSTQRRTLIGDSAKVIEHHSGRIEDYDLGADPQEKAPGSLASSRREPMIAALHKILAELQERRSPASTQALDAQTREQMRALGYDVGK